MEMTKNKKRIWLDYPAKTSDGDTPWWAASGWNEAFPIGNGRIGGMVYGDPIADRIQLNEETVWYGSGGRNRVNPEAVNSYKEVQRLLVEGKIAEAVNLEEKSMFPIDDQQRSYDTAGDVYISFSHQGYDNYKRSLDLESAVCTVEFTSGGVRYVREYFVSAPDSVLVVRQYSPDGGKTSCKISFPDRDGDAFERHLADDALIMKGQEGEGGCSFIIGASCECEGGTCILEESGIEVFDSDSAVLYIAIKSDFATEDPEALCVQILENAQALGFDTLKYRHIQDYKSYFDRAVFRLDGTDYDDIPTDKRLELLKERPDNRLFELYFDFGRYLLISSSRPGTKPANLQGIWNKDRHPAWGSKYTININAEMNYWLAENTNLSDCHMPLLEHLKVMLPNGQKVARDMYGLDGFVAHHNTDIFGDCAPQDRCITATIWPTGAAWLCTHIWTHYIYTLDKKMLSEYLPIIKQASLFMAEFLFETPSGLVIGPSLSPENTYIHSSGESGQICVGATMDTMIIRDLFNICIEASQILGQCDDLTERLKSLLPRLKEPSIGSKGQLMEWSEDYDEKEPGHRHISHLYGLYPSNQISCKKTPLLAEAARVTLQRRLSGGGGHTGWSRAWIINMFARLQDGENAYSNLSQLLTSSTYPDFLDKHPPFQIDGNFGGAAGIAEMLLQSQDGIIRLLPAIPDCWQSGSVKGLKAAGDISVDIAWENKKVVYAKLTAEQGGTIRICVPEGFSGSGEAEFSDTHKFSVVLDGGKIILQAPPIHIDKGDL